MRHSKHGLKAFGLCLLAALSLTAFAAASAQAQTGWLESGAFITADKTVKAELHEPQVLLDSTLAGGTTVQIECTVLTSSESKIFGTSVALRPLAEGLIKLESKECETFLNGVLSKVCKPKEPITATAKFKAILHTSGDKKTYILFEPDEKKAFTIIEFPNEECVLFPAKEVTGDLVAECLNEKLEKNSAGTDYCLEDAVNHYIREAPNGLFELGEKTGKFHELLFGSPPRRANLLGVAKVSLTGSGIGHTWGVHI